MERRHFLGVAFAGILGACTQDVQLSEPTPSSTIPPPVPAGEAPSTTAIPPTSDPTTTSPGPEALATEPVNLSAAPFDLGIASGDPTSETVVIWTRMTGELPEEVPLVWEVASDPEFGSLLATGRAVTSPASGYSLRIDVPGLPAASSLLYRFRVGDYTSTVGRTRTFAPPGQPAPPLRLAVSSCQANTDGAYAAHRSIASSDLDAVVWLGDYIYGQSETLQEYRATYAQYRSDPALQAAHAAHPWIMIWDDHEIMNDFDLGVDPSRLRSGLQAWWENQPVRLPEPDSNGLVGYRSFVVGDLCRILMLDTRQYSDADDSGSGSILGSIQRDWLLNELDHDATWSIVASPVLASGLSAPTSEPGPLLSYTWDGAPEDRQQLAEALTQQDAIIVSGDLHTSMVLDFKADPTDPLSDPAAPEFMAPSISSQFPARFASAAPLLGLFNSQLQHIDLSNGWLLLEITAEKIVATFQYVSDVQDPDSDVLPGPSYEVLRGESAARLLT